MYKTFKQYLLEASNLSEQDKETIKQLITSCHIKDRHDINSWLDTIVYNFIVNKSNHTNSDFFTKEEIINVKGQKDIQDKFNDVNGALKNKINDITDYLNKTYTVEQASIKFGNNLVRLSFVDAEKEYKKAPHNTKEIEGIDYKVVKKYKDGYKIISLLTQKSLTREGNCLGHCTKDEQLDYLTHVNNHIIQILSLRDNYNRPHATLEYNIAFNSINQIKGNGNGPVISKYIPYIIEYLNDYTFKEIDDLHHINAIKIGNKIVDKDHIPHDLIIKTNVDLNELELTQLPQFPQRIYASFDCSFNRLSSLKGSPLYIQRGWFYCRHNQLETLEHGPSYVKEDFDCSNNILSSLEGAPVYVGGDFDCSDNFKLESLEGLSKTTIGGDFICNNIGKDFSEKEIRNHCTIIGKVIHHENI